MHNDDLRELYELRGEIDTLLAANVIKASEETQFLRDLVDLMVTLLGPAEEGDVKPGMFCYASDLLATSGNRDAIPRYHSTYILDEQGNPTPTNDWRAVHRLMRNIKKRRVAKTHLEFRGIKVEISTVFSPFNMAHGPARPVLWETMTFGRHCYEFDEIQERYCSRCEAEQGHRMVVDIARAYLHRKRSIHSPRRMAVAQRRITAGQGVQRKAVK